MAKKTKKKLTKVQATRQRDGRILLFILITMAIPVVLMLLGIGTPGLAFKPV